MDGTRCVKYTLHSSHDEKIFIDFSCREEDDEGHRTDSYIMSAHLSFTFNTPVCLLQILSMNSFNYLACNLNLHPFILADNWM